MEINKLNKKIFTTFFILTCFTGFACQKESSNSSKSTPQNSDSTNTPSQQPPPPTQPAGKIFGVTVDSVSNLNEVIISLQNLSQKPTARIVFDEGVSATSYKNAVQKIHQVAFIMGEILDSYYVKDFTLEQYLDRTKQYYEMLSDDVDIWEVGNEINGEWLGDPDQVSQKMIAAYDFIKSKEKKTSLTLYYNEACWMYPSEEIFTWASKNIPIRMKNGLDFVLISYYEDDCNGLQPNWESVFVKLAKMFPNSKIGFGEIGTTKSISAKSEMIERYYRLNINSSRFIGGYFWWYFVQDMVPFTKPMWQVLNNNLAI